MITMLQSNQIFQVFFVLHIQEKKKEQIWGRKSDTQSSHLTLFTKSVFFQIRTCFNTKIQNKIFIATDLNKSVLIEYIVEIVILLTKLCKTTELRSILTVFLHLLICE